jgi:hypothetical protein
MMNVLLIPATLSLGANTLLSSVMMMMLVPMKLVTLIPDVFTQIFLPLVMTTMLALKISVTQKLSPHPDVNIIILIVTMMMSAQMTHVNLIQGVFIQKQIVMTIMHVQQTVVM